MTGLISHIVVNEDLQEQQLLLIYWQNTDSEKWLPQPSNSPEFMEQEVLFQSSKNSASLPSSSRDPLVDIRKTLSLRTFLTIFLSATQEDN